MELFQQIAAWGLQSLLFIVGLAVIAGLAVLAFVLFWIVIVFPLRWATTVFDSAKTPNREPPAK